MIDEIKLTKNLIKINSTNPGKFEKDVFNFVENLLNKKKIKYKKYILNKNRPNLVIKIGNKSIKDNVLFIGHLDTVPFGQLKWKYDPIGARELNGKIYGRGSTDMKSAVASMCAAILNRKDYNFKNKNIILALVSGEETGCEGSKLLAKKLQKELNWIPKESFKTGIKKTIEWYLDNNEWMQNIVSGEYETYYKKQYKYRYFVFSCDDTSVTSTCLRFILTIVLFVKKYKPPLIYIPDSFL